MSEQEKRLYYQAARFAGDAEAGQAYLKAQAEILRAPEADLSTYRLQLNQVWHVTVLGEQPTRVLERRLRRILATGEPATLPDEVLELLQRRRAQATELGPWVEKHQRPGERFQL
jgi:hypothetical protein